MCWWPQSPTGHLFQETLGTGERGARGRLVSKVWLNGYKAATFLLLGWEDQYNQTGGPGDTDSSVSRQRPSQSAQRYILQDSQGFVHLINQTLLVLDIFLFLW